MLTLATEDHGKVPELGHVEGLEDLTLVGSTVTVKSERDVLLVVVLVGESKTSTDGNLSTDDTVATVEAGSEHVHGTTLAVGNTATATSPPCPTARRIAKPHQMPPRKLRITAA